MSHEQELIPIEQQTLTFYGKPIIVVRLPDGRPGVVLRFLCENLHIDTNAQMQRIQRSEAMAEDLVFTRVETPGGAQRMATLLIGHGSQAASCGSRPSYPAPWRTPSVMKVSSKMRVSG